jgi:hypothetical protein
VRVFELPSPEGLGFARARLKCRWRERARVHTYTPTRPPIPKLIYEQRSLLICMWHACGIRRSTHTHCESLLCTASGSESKRRAEIGLLPPSGGAHI